MQGRQKGQKREQKREKEGERKGRGKGGRFREDKGINKNGRKKNRTSQGLG
jgi:hypothetical protein